MAKPINAARIRNLSPCCSRFYPKRHSMPPTRAPLVRLAANVGGWRPHYDIAMRARSLTSNRRTIYGRPRAVKEERMGVVH
jgi:hypothetical protein